MSSRRSGRIAWLGTPMDTGTVTYISTQLLERLVDFGFEIDCYSPSDPEVVPERLLAHPQMRFHFEKLRYRSGRWYSRSKLQGFVIGQSERALAQARLTERLRREHALNPYDCLYQMSQLELFAVRALRHHLPPIVVHPHTHAAGELRWLRREKDLAARSTTRQRETAVRAMMLARAQIQMRDIRLAEMVVSPSARFADHLSADYAFPRDRIAVVPNPIDLSRHVPRPLPEAHARETKHLLFVSRMSVRKGVDMVIRLSHQLADMVGKVHIHVIGDRSAWSDYRGLLSDLNPATATYHGFIPEQVLAELYLKADLVMQPSRFEPFGLTIAESLASGIPVITSDEVGAIDGVKPDVCRTFPDGDSEAFAATVRQLLQELSAPAKRSELAAEARAEAERLFSPDRSAEALARALKRLGSLPPRTAPVCAASWN